MKSLVTGLAALLIGASLTFAACGGDDNTSKTTATAGGDGKTDSPTTSGGSTYEKTPGSGQVTGSGADSLRNLAKDLGKKTYQVSYDLEATGVDGKVTKSSLTLAQKPPKSATSITNGAAASFTLINDGTNTFTCIPAPAGGGQCTKAKADATSPLSGNLFSLDKTLQSLTENVNVSESGSRNVAGADSRCYTIKETNGNDALACFTKSDGIMTYVENKAGSGSKSTLTATKISTSVPDSMFAPPADYKVIDAPAR